MRRPGRSLLFSGLLHPDLRHFLLKALMGNDAQQGLWVLTSFQSSNGFFKSIQSCCPPQHIASDMNQALSSQSQDETVPPALDDFMRLEADIFLMRLPTGLQTRQCQAILSAIGGDTTALQDVRAARNAAMSAVPGVQTQELDAHLRLYTRTPQGDDAAPLLVYFHGGGWTFGSLNSCARFCARFCQRSGASVLAVDYPLAPEHPYPAALDACVEAVKQARLMAKEWGCDPSRIALGGDSSGGNLAIATALRLAAEGVTDLSALLLFYPVTKVWNDSSPSWRLFGKGYGLDSYLMKAFSHAYAGSSPQRPLISVALADDEIVRQLPPTLIVSAGRDILADQGEAFAMRLRHLGVKTRHVVFPSAVHLFITMPGQSMAFERAVETAMDFLHHPDGTISTQD